MEIIIAGITFIFLLIIIISAADNRSNKLKNVKPQLYNYTAKSTIMTRSEEAFFRRLSDISASRYVVFPQVHLSAFVDFKVKGQNWSAALRHINGKSVDYLLCDISTLQPVYAVELDDPSHSETDRQERDAEVARILQQAGVPLVRFTNTKYLSNEEIIQRFAGTKAAIGQ